MLGRASSARKPKERLSVRRRRRRRYVLVVWAVLFVVVVGAVFYGLWRPQVRISKITISGGAPQSLATVAADALQGSFLGLPNNSIFFISKSRIRSRILATDPRIAAVSIYRSGFHSLSIHIDYRSPIARWCGTTTASTTAQDTPVQEVIPNPLGTCYLFDAGGFIYATATPQGASPIVFGATSTAATSTQNTQNTTTQDATPLTSFTLFDTLAHPTNNPIASTLAHAAKLPAVFDFARRVASFGAPVKTIVIRGGEVDFFLGAPASGATTGPRITYLLGDEVNAFAALVSARADFNLKDGSVQYLDLRFPGKVYLKKVGLPKG